MKYFVKIDMTPPTSYQELIQHLEQVVIPHFELIIRLEAEKKILASGVFPGARAGVFIVDVDSHEELDQLLLSIPGWALFKIDVIPLQSNEGRIKIARKALEHLKAAK